MSDAGLGLLIAGIASAAAIAYGVILVRAVLAQPQGNERMQDIAQAIQEGAEAYMRRQYRIVAIVAVVVASFLHFYWTLRQRWASCWAR